MNKCLYYIYCAHNVASDSHLPPFTPCTLVFIDIVIVYLLISTPALWNTWHTDVWPNFHSTTATHTLSEHYPGHVVFLSSSSWLSRCIYNLHCPPRLFCLVPCLHYFPLQAERGAVSLLSSPLLLPRLVSSAPLTAESTIPLLPSSSSSLSLTQFVVTSRWLG